MTLSRPSWLRLLLAAGLAAALALSMLVGVQASSHREAPLITEDPVADNTDVYAFVSPDKPDTVTLISNWIPFENPAGGPNFYNFGDDVLYEFEIDNDGDAVQDIEFEFRFHTKIVNPNTFLYATGPISVKNGKYSSTFNYRQFYTVSMTKNGRRHVLGRNLPVPPNNVGPRSTPNYGRLANAGIHRVKNGVKVFAGQRDEAFPVDLGSIFDLAALRPLQPAHILPPNQAQPGINSTDGFNVHSIALQVPKHLVTKSSKQPVIGVYSTTYRRRTRVYQGARENGAGANPKHRGTWVQVSRLGNPLVNELVIPLKDKDRFNASDPRFDKQFAKYVATPFLDNALASVIKPGVFSCFPNVNGPRNDLVTIYLTGVPGLNALKAKPTPAEYLRLNTAIAPSGDNPNQQSSLGLLGGELDGFPNGRRLNDDVVDISLRAVAGATPVGACAGEAPNDRLGDGVAGNDKRYMTRFPYIPHPFSGYEDPNGERAPRIILQPNA